MSALRKEVIDFDYGQEEVIQTEKKNRIKSKKKNKNVRESIKNTLMIATTFILGILIVYNYAVITDKQMELNLLNQEISSLNDDIDSYNIALEGIKNTNSIEEMAKVYLGMNYPSRKQTIFVDFTYGNSEVTNELKATEEESSNIIVGIIDKVVGLIQ